MQLLLNFSGMFCELFPARCVGFGEPEVFPLFDIYPNEDKSLSISSNVKSLGLLESFCQYSFLQSFFSFSIFSFTMSLLKHISARCTL